MWGQTMETKYCKAIGHKYKFDRGNLQSNNYATETSRLNSKVG
jgi:hypothetical protein